MSNINDVAKEAGVSITTVSRYLNNSYPVNVNTKKAIQEAINKLNYKPNAIARGLVRKKTNTVGIIVPYITNMFFPEVVRGISDQCNAKGYDIILVNSNSDGFEEKKAVENFLERQVDGIVIIAPKIEKLPPSFYRKLNKTLPLVLVNKYFNDKDIVFIYNDERDGAFKATEYLLDLGHKNILFISGSENSYSSEVKIKGFNKALKSRGLLQKKNSEDNDNILISDYTSENTFKLIKSNMEHVRKHSAIFCANDLMAIGVIKALRSEGYEVPRDFSVMGFDDISISALYEPGISTVSQNITSLGKVSGDAIIKLISKEDVVRNQVLNTSLIIRDSCSRIKE
ncbi:LacI family DNA-binding transcriptional regulator [Ruminiclostridium cellobioparum]|uniref:Transcriptional regulator n=1 Tax=Ruminiclostridium cellobioparum subsp. termitidis CT1112 TaxID=1195236 RepID=S0FSR3_RUMCE|nr:LacI family DNA-binding transcriptional regulator [Ruminiclostridium cellobioparum]EMS72219.1 transcriptional regulator [Ruminiclostridium cellobioparum subsp. termitidis CT1112]